MLESLQFVGHGNSAMELSNQVQFSATNAVGQFFIVAPNVAGEKSVVPDRNVCTLPSHADPSKRIVADVYSPATSSANLILSKGEGGSLPTVKKAEGLHNLNSKPNSPDAEVITPTSTDGGTHHNDISFSALNSDTFNILSVDKKTMLCIPVDLIESTSGSKRYLEQGASASFTFRFQLCRGYRDRGGCNHRGECSFIHSRHVLDAALAARVKETPVHAYVVLANVNETIPHTTFPEAVALEVFDSTTQQNLLISSSMLLETRGAQAAYDKHFVDGTAGSLQKANGRDVLLHHMHPTGAALMSQRSVPQQPQNQLFPRSSIVLATSGNTAPARLQFCLHFDRGMCARGKECMFAHRVVISSPPPGAWILQAEPVPEAATAKRSSVVDGGSLLHCSVQGASQLNRGIGSSQEIFGSYGYLPLAAATTTQRQQLMTMPTVSVMHDVAQHAVPLSMMPQNTQQFIFAPTQSSVASQWSPHGVPTQINGSIGAWQQQGDNGMHESMYQQITPTPFAVPQQQQQQQQQAQLAQQRQWISHNQATHFM